MKKITYIKSITITIALFGVVALGFGQDIFSNIITGTNPGQINPYFTGQYVDPNISVNGISRGIGVSGRNANDRYNAINWDSASLDLNDYFEFTLTPNTTFEIDFVNFVYTGQVSPTGPINFAFRSSLDGYSANIGIPTTSGTTIDLSSGTYQDISSAITFRFYGWGASGSTGTFSINDFTFNGVISALTCPTTVTWNGTSWDAPPTSTTSVVIDGDYTATTANSFSACSLYINEVSSSTTNPVIVRVNNGGFIEVENNVIVDGTLIVETQGNFVQRGNTGTFTVSGTGTASVNKITPPKADWFYYTYWSSPVVGETIGNVFPLVDADRRYSFNAAGFVDTDGDDIGETGNDWQTAMAGNTMLPGVGYAATAARLHFPGATDIATFTGEFNTRDVPVNITFNPANLGMKWNFIGNPYPSAIDFNAFHTANSTVVEGVAYFWDQGTPPSTANPGNENLNFSLDDYATYAVGVGGVGARGDTGSQPNGFIASGQGFFIPSTAIGGTATFTNAMRMANGTSNTQFFKAASAKKSSTSSSSENRLWVNLTSDNGVFNQILVGYVDNATNAYDGMAFDAPRLIPENYGAVLYSTIENVDTKYVIQGKSLNSINNDEVLNIGFSTKIDVPTLYKLSIAQLQGHFLNNNTIYIKDNLLNKLHNLSTSDYTFTSETGEFNDRFEIVFNDNALSTNDVISDSKSLKIVELKDDNVQFTTSNTIKTIRIFDLLGRQLYEFKGQTNSETYKLSKISSTVYIAKVELSNGAIITKKAVKR
ncbi:hypothetical protein GCM10023314_29310 [Algibacter agarivorans]|uniref:Por secretion system C-terminal sorting domain-containing protein n=1 Tax=Algibacter agarivorans TaxID=1109741 RepID=A0ABP9GY69_9FLAO